MEKQGTLKNKILKIAAAVTVTFQNPPFSPGRDHKFKSHGGKGVSMIPDEVRRRPKNQSGETQEPTSPKISCMGQIKHKKKGIKPPKGNNNKSVSREGINVTSVSSTPVESEVKKQKRPPKFQRMFMYGGKPKTGRRKSSRWVEGKKEDSMEDDRAPPVGEMRRFASGRETFSNFDWKAQIAPEELELDRGCYTDDERVETDVEEEQEEDDDEVKIPFSAPILIGGGGGSVPNLQPRKEINLWKRRTMERPRPLQLKPVLTAS